MKNLSSLMAVLAVLLCLTTSYGQYPIRINTGGSQITGADGNVYEADNSSYYSAGTLTTTRNVDGLVAPYNTIRYAPDAAGQTMTYTIPVANGDYNVTLHFAETWFGTTGGGTGSANQRIFDVNIEGGSLEIDNMDLYDLYGAATPHTETFNNITVTDLGLTIYFTAQSGDGGIKHPLINAIEIHQAGGDNQAPTPVPSNVVASGATSNAVNLTWNGSSDPSGILEYRIYAQTGGTGAYSQIATSTTVGTPVSVLSPDTTYNFTVTAVDNATPSNETIQSGASNSITTSSSTGPGNGDAISVTGYNATNSVNGFRNKIELIDTNHAAIVYNSGQANELMFGMNGNGNFYWGTGGSTATKPNYYSMQLNGSNGDLGIRGRLTSNEVKVKLAGWADYVFYEDYALPTLQEVAQHIEDNGHLINIPSSADVEANGIELGEMNKLLLEKIEELTLYVIEQEKRIKTLEKNTSNN